MLLGKKFLILLLPGATLTCDPGRLASPLPKEGPPRQSSCLCLSQMQMLSLDWLLPSST